MNEAADTDELGLGNWKLISSSVACLLACLLATCLVFFVDFFFLLAARYFAAFSPSFSCVVVFFNKSLYETQQKLTFHVSVLLAAATLPLNCCFSLETSFSLPLSAVASVTFKKCLFLKLLPACLISWHLNLAVFLIKVVSLPAIT